jgi:5'(3')-deoxyribonucleotidase
MRILLDVDGVMADFSQGVIDRLRLRTKLTPEDITQWDIFGLLEEKFSFYHKKLALELMDVPDFWRRLPCVDGAYDAYIAIEAMGHEIVFVTSPWDSCHGWNVARRLWLEEHFGITKDQLVITHAKHLVRGDILIDDRESHITDWNRIHGTGGILFAAPYNKTNEHKHLRLDWAGVLERLEEV